MPHQPFSNPHPVSSLSSAEQVSQLCANVLNASRVRFILKLPSAKELDIDSVLPVAAFTGTAESLDLLLSHRRQFMKGELIHANALMSLVLKPILDKRDVEKLDVVFPHLSPERLQDTSFKGLLWACEADFKMGVDRFLASGASKSQVNKALRFVLDKELRSHRSHTVKSEHLAPHANLYKLFKTGWSAKNMLLCERVVELADLTTLVTILTLPNLDLSKLPRLQAESLRLGLSNFLQSSPATLSRQRL